MKRIVGTIFAAFLGLVLLFVAVPVILMPSLVTGARSIDIPASTILEVDLRPDFRDQSRARSSILSDGQPAILDLVEILSRAEEDDRVKGVFLLAGEESQMPLAQAEELRDAFAAFKAKDKFVIGYSKGFHSQHIGAFYASSAADELWMTSSGTVSASSVFLEKVAAHLSEPDSASARIIDTHLGTGEAALASNRQKKALSETLMRQATLGIADSLGMSPGDIRDLLAEGPWTARAALNAGLITHLGDDAQARTSAAAKAGSQAAFLQWTDYADDRPSRDPGLPVIAVIEIEGEIADGESDARATDIIGGESTARALRSAADSSEVQAVLFRIDSIGGSAVGSDQIWEAVTYTRQSGKPVVVSMGSVAASGGYYAAMAANMVIAQPSTITGSIGLSGGKFVLGNTWGTLGLDVSEVAAGGFLPDAINTPENMTDDTASDAQWQSVGKALGGYYEDFTSRVAENRDLSPDKVGKVAGGRVWAGEQARDLGLIDALGGYRLAIAETKQLAGIGTHEAVELRNWPGAGSPMQRLAKLQDVTGSAGRVMLTFSQLGQVDTIRDLLESIYNGVGPEELKDAEAMNDK